LLSKTDALKEQILNFSEFPLRDTLLRAIEERGFTEPTEIQEEAIPFLCLNDSDFVGQAQTGTGKTAAFALPLLNKLRKDTKSVQAIILAPTRELANQICEEIRKFSIHERIRVESVYGGVSIDNQVRNIRKFHPQIIVGTPGRVLDLINRKVLKLEDATFACLDEADEMLDMGFLDDVKTILSELGTERNIWMFSATMPPAILDLIRNYLNDPKVIKIKKSTLSNENITQKCYVVKEMHMREAVCRLLDSVEEYYGIIFTKTKLEAKSVCDELNFRGFPTDSLHGDMDQKQRDFTMKKFKEKRVKLLVCTDVAARGIDVDHLTHVFNFGLPQDLESYVHRIGRTGRAGQKGMALSIVTPSEIRKLGALERLTKAKILREKIPTLELLKDAMVRRTINQFEDIFTEIQTDDKVDASFDLFKDEFEDLDKEQVLKVLFKHTFQDAMQRLDREPIIDANTERRASEGPGQAGVPDRNGNVRFFVNAGRDDGLTLKDLLMGVSDGLKIDQRKIRNVQLREKFSFMDVPATHSEQLVNDVNIEVGSKRVRFEPTKENRGGGDRGGRSFGGRSGGGGRSFGGGGRDSRGGGRSSYGSRDSGGSRGGGRSFSGSRDGGGSRGGNSSGGNSGGERNFNS